MRDDEPSNLRLNGRTLTVREKREYEARNAERFRDNFADIVKHRKAPGGHEPYWGAGHDSLSGGIPVSQAREHAEWIRSAGLTGIQVNDTKDGMATVSGSSPSNWKKYLEARGMVSTSKNGVGILNEKPAKKKPKVDERTKKKILDRYRARQGVA